jgi:hypothetical protein
MFAYYGPEWEALSKSIAMRICPSFTGSTGMQPLDVSGFQNHGNLVNFQAGGNKAYVVVERGLSLAFGNDAIDDYVAVPVLLAGVTKFTLSLWVYSSRSQAAYYSAGVSGVFTTDILLAVSGGTLFSQVNNGSDGGATISYTPAATWRMITAVFDGTQTSNTERSKIYVNGIAQTATYGSHTVPSVTASSASASARLGSYVSSNPNWYLGGGFLDDVIISRDSWNASEVKYIYEQGRGGGMLYQPPRRRSYLAAATTKRRRRIICGSNC